MAADVRKIPLSEVLSSRGFVARKEGNSTMWRGNAQAINVTGDALWFDHKSGKGGVGTIDLVMHLDGQSFREAVHSLSGGHHGRFDAHSAAATPLAERRPLGELMDEYARRDDTRWPYAFAYLTKRRCLPAEVVDELHKCGRVYANDRGGVVFLHHDELGQLGGATIKSSNPILPFRAMRRQQNRILVSRGLASRRLPERLQSPRARSTPFPITCCIPRNIFASFRLPDSISPMISCESAATKRLSSRSTTQPWSAASRPPTSLEESSRPLLPNVRTHIFTLPRQRIGMTTCARRPENTT